MVRRSIGGLRRVAAPSGGGAEGGLVVWRMEAVVRGLLKEDIVGLLLFVARVAEEHQLSVVFPLGHIKVFRTAGFVSVHCLMFTLEDGPQVPKLCLYVFHYWEEQQITSLMLEKSKAVH